MPQDIRDLSFEELTAYLTEIGEKSFRAQQIFEWIYQKNAWNFEAMKNLPQPLRMKLKADFILAPNRIAQKLAAPAKEMSK